MQWQCLSSSLLIKEIEALQAQIAQLVNMSFILGVVLGVFLKMIIEDYANAPTEKFETM